MPGAFASGYDVNKATLYVDRAVFRGTYSIDYYHGNAMLGYFMIYGKVRTSQSMEILEVLWISTIAYEVIWHLQC